MAVAETADMLIQKNSQILVHVEESLADLIVVSYCAENRKFQGVLLDSNKGNLPFGVYNIHPAFSRQSASEVNNDDKLHSANQRFLYEDPDYESKLTQKRKPGPKCKPQPQKMTVRLRPRKVLCSKCKGICNENNENVDVSKKRKLDTDDDTHRESDSSRDLSEKKKYLMAGGMLIPKISRLHPSEISSAIKGLSKVSKNSNKASDKLNDNENVTPELTFVNVSDTDVDENKNSDSYPMFSSARTLKICFGEGEGTVVKIPPLSGDYNEDSGVSCDMTKPESKAAKKALKRAKKQAKKNSILTKNLVQSPKHIGALSPRNVADSPPIDPLEKKNKHRVKHKKKYKSCKKRDENSEKEAIGYFSNIKSHCMNQKLSISLRRLSSNSLEQQTSVQDSEGDCNTEMRDKQQLKLAVKQAPDAHSNELHSTDPLASPSQQVRNPNLSNPSNLLASPVHSLGSPSTLTLSPHPVDVFM